MMRNTTSSIFRWHTPSMTHNSQDYFKNIKTQHNQKNFRCHTSYVTNYDSQQEEECEENFKKVKMENNLN